MNRHTMSGTALLTDGLIALVAGFSLLFFTGIPQTLFVYLFAGFAVIYGAGQLVAANGEREPGKNPWAFWAPGAFSVIAGLGILLFVNYSLETIITLIASYAIIMGISEALIAYSYNDIHGFGWLASMGFLQALFGLALLFYTNISLETLIVSIATYAMVVGALTAGYGYQLAQSKHVLHTP